MSKPKLPFQYEVLKASIASDEQIGDGWLPDKVSLEALIDNESRYQAPDNNLNEIENFKVLEPISGVKYNKLTSKQINNLKQNIWYAIDTNKIKINDEGVQRTLDLRDFIFTAWVSASTYRNNDKRGGSNGAKILLEPAKFWSFVDYNRVSLVVKLLLGIKESLNIHMSTADLIIFAGNAAIEKAVRNSGYIKEISFVGGRRDAIQSDVDVDNFSDLEPIADGFLNWVRVPKVQIVPFVSFPVPEDNQIEQYAEYLFIDKAASLNLTPQDLVVLFAGFRAMQIRHRESIFYDLDNKEYKLNNHFLKYVILRPEYEWQKIDMINGENKIELPNRYFKLTKPNSKDTEFLMSSRVDPIFSVHPLLREIAETYAFKKNEEQFINDFILAWTKVMTLGNFS